MLTQAVGINAAGMIVAIGRDAGDEAALLGMTMMRITSFPLAYFCSCPRGRGHDAEATLHARHGVPARRAHVASSMSVNAQSDQVGQWTTLTTLPFFPVHVHLLPTGKVMIWPGDGGISGNDPRLWNPANQNLTTLAQAGV